MIEVKSSHGLVQDIYGITAIGTWCRAFYLRRNHLVLEPKLQGRTLSVLTDSLEIEDQMRDWAADITAYGNV
jgi:hypothetical protein